MYLKRLTVSGFKSFAGKTELEFERGITAIVGPNGSGKSNIADAVRWALGEQSVKQLRMKKGEELVFAGTDKRAKASMAEVSLLLDNSDGVLALDFAEVELSRVIYRSGESEYRINGRKARLTEIQHLLATAGFGQNSYTVIGQGMIDSFILSTPAERKMLFDEASGIRQYELKREQALKKLDATTDNLTRVKDITGELEPRLKHLAKAVESSQERNQLRLQLQTEQSVYIATAEWTYRQRQKEIAAETEQLQAREVQLKEEIKQLEAQRQTIEHAKPTQVEGTAQALHELEIERDELSNDTSVKKAELQFLVEKLEDQEHLADEVKAQEAKAGELKSQQVAIGASLKQQQKAEVQAAKELDVVAEKIRTSQAKLASLRDQLRETSNGEFISHALSILRHIAQNPQLDANQIRDLVARAGRLLVSASLGDGDVMGAVRQAQQTLAEAMKRREDAHDSYTATVIKVRALEMDLAKSLDDQSQLAEQITQMRMQAEGRHKTSDQITARRKHLVVAEKRLDDIAGEITQRRSELAQSQMPGLSADEIFTLATKLEAAHQEARAINTRLGELKQDLTAIAHEEKELLLQARAWDVPSAEPSQKPLDQLERGLAILEGRLAESGDNDEAVMEEYREASERYQFLTGQVMDLEAAQTDLGTVITQLDKLIKAKFETGFETIARHFSQNFERLFEGGRASLSLKMDDEGTYGIEIKATPPGKRVESLSTLSGGEG